MSQMNGFMNCFMNYHPAIMQIWSQKSCRKRVAVYLGLHLKTVLYNKQQGLHKEPLMWFLK